MSVRMRQCDYETDYDAISQFLTRIHQTDPPQNDELPDDKLYPHIYGPLNVDAVTQVVDFNPLSHGTFELPEVFREKTD